MIQKQKAVQETMLQHFEVRTSEYKQSNKRQQQEIDLHFQQQEQQEKEVLQHDMEEELQLGNKKRAQEEADKEIATGGSGTDIDVNYVNKNVDIAI